MPSEFKLNSFVLDLSFISLLNQSIIDVTLCALDSLPPPFVLLRFFSTRGYVLYLSTVECDKNSKKKNGRLILIKDRAYPISWRAWSD